jgi:hypothetical protein
MRPIGNSLKNASNEIQAWNLWVLEATH